MGKHDKYVKSLLAEILEDQFSQNNGNVDYAAGVAARIDGVIDNSCAVEIESRTPKQIRGALIDLLFHPFKKKFLIIVPTPAVGHNPQRIAVHCQCILQSLKKRDEKCEVVLLSGTGNHPNQRTDKQRIKNGLHSLHVL